MDAQFDTQGRPVPSAFVKAVGDFASQTGLDAQALIQGNALDHDGILFWLRHYADDDANGVTVQMDIGEAPANEQTLLAMTTPMLQSHLLQPPGKCGYYGYLPELNRLVHCTRIALDQVSDGAGSITAAIAMGSALLSGIRAESARLNAMLAGSPS